MCFKKEEQKNSGCVSKHATATFDSAISIIRSDNTLYDPYKISLIDVIRRWWPRGYLAGARCGDKQCGPCSPIFWKVDDDQGRDAQFGITKNNYSRVEFISNCSLEKNVAFTTIEVPTP